MQRNTIVPMLMMVAMFGMFIHYDLTSSTQYSVIDSVWTSIILIIFLFAVVIIRSRGESALDFFASITNNVLRKQIKSDEQIDL